mgnify:CR=1 FL=1
MAMTFIRSTRAVRQITMDTYVLQKSISPLNYLPWIIPLDFFGTRIIQLQHILVAFTILVYYTCVEFRQYWFICLGEVALTRNMDRQTDRVIPIYTPKLCLLRAIHISLCHHRKYGKKGIYIICNLPLWSVKMSTWTKLTIYAHKTVLALVVCLFI